MAELILLIAVLAVIAIFIVMFALTRLLLIAQPNEVIVLSGRRRRLPTGEVVGYRIIRGGRAIRIPFIEKAARMSLETIPIELSVTNAYSKGGIPLKVEAIANIKIDSTEPAFGNAVERFLNMRREQIHAIAKDTLEGNLRGVLASLTPEEVNEDRLKFAEVLIDEAVGDLNQLGLKLDILKITNISDERGYLDSIGRIKTAELLARAKKVEAEKQAEAEEAEALSQERAQKARSKAHQEIESARINAEQNVLILNANKEAETREAEANALARAEKAKAQSKQDIEIAQITAQQNIKITDTKAQQAIEIERNNLRMKKAELEKEAVIKEKEAEVAGRKAQVIYEQELEAERVILQQKKLLADVIEPAKARKEAMELEAKGKAASIIADGEAKRAVLEQMINVYNAAKETGEKVYMLNILPQIVDSIVSTIKQIKIDKLTVIDSSGTSSDGSLSKLVNQFPGLVTSLTEMLENTTGVNILSHFKKDKKQDKDGNSNENLEQ